MPGAGDGDHFRQSDVAIKEKAVDTKPGSVVEIAPPATDISLPGCEDNIVSPAVVLPRSSSPPQHRLS